MRDGSLIECPHCKSEAINHDDEAYHLDKELGDVNVLCCDECGWVGNVRISAEFEELSADAETRKKWEKMCKIR